ncbi:hypothetical protein D3C78_895920 [compost metagenome]
MSAYSLSLSAVKSLPSKATFPSSMLSIPLNANISVDLPDPEGPITETNSPSWIWTVTLLRALCCSSPSPKDFTIFSPLTIFLISYSFIFPDILICPAPEMPILVAIRTAHTIINGHNRYAETGLTTK